MHTLPWAILPEMSATFMGLALLLGFKHSYDADHIIAVSNIIVRSPSKLATAKLSVSWAVGHMLTAASITVGLWTLKETLLRELLAGLENAVIVMLFVIGILGLLAETSYYHEHIHRHRNEAHSHRHFHPLGRLFYKNHESSGEPHAVMMGIGIVHGLASNDELLILFAASLGVTSLLGLIVGVGIFSAGVVAGMIVYGLGLSFPILRYGKPRVKRVINITVAVLSILYAGLLFFGVGAFNPFAGLLPV